MDKEKQQRLSAAERDEYFELRLVQEGYSAICGVDEAGRGPLAGPVVAAAVLFKDCPTIWNCRDSKQISRKYREKLCIDISCEFVCGIGQCSPREIEEMNIRQASLEAMRRAIVSLKMRPEIILVDGRDPVPIDIASLPIIKGDARVSVISAASILAKVTRDHIMTEYDLRYPDYGFSRHYGYPTPAHRRAIQALGPCPIHRRSFRGVREYI
ncbi:ribonuclease HII [bacterium]|nr:ribonuclease HII [bacterium]MBU1638225.1 ribonuclease HII [bacterium]MBU1920160.1 ribonuclease HII [bacterium]RQV99404.1 MAG: ribonuclease HII [bacterium]